MSLTPDEMDRKKELLEIQEHRPLNNEERAEMQRLKSMEFYRGTALGDR